MMITVYLLKSSLRGIHRTIYFPIYEGMCCPLQIMATYVLFHNHTFSKTFDKYFKFNAGDVYLKDREEWDLDVAFDDLMIRIEAGNVVPINRQDMIEYNTFGNHIESQHT